MFKIAWLLLVFIPLIIDWKQTLDYIKESKNLYKKLRIRHFLLGLLSVVSVIIMTIILYNNFSIMRFGWLWSLFTNNNSDNRAGNTTDTSIMINIVSSIVIIILYVFLLIIIPSLAQREEEIFRERAIESKFSIQLNKKVCKDKTIVPLLYQVFFGLIHMIMGIPLATACSLIISGIIFYLTAKYSFIHYYNYHIKKITYDNKEEEFVQYMKTYFGAEDYAVEQSTLVHSAHNIIVITTGIITITITLFM